MILGIIIGFFGAWVVLAIAMFLMDNKGIGICFFDGWGANIILAPVYLPLYFIVRPIYRIITKHKKG